MKKRSKVILNIILFTKLQGKPSNDAVTNDFPLQKRKERDNGQNHQK
jgi:hypothetical protein